MTCFILIPVPHVCTALREQYESSCRELRMRAEQATTEAMQMRRTLAAKDEELATACGCGGGEGMSKWAPPCVCGAHGLVGRP